MATDAKQMTERERADEKVRAIVEELDRPTLALLYRTLHDALGFRIETTDIAIGRRLLPTRDNAYRAKGNGMPVATTLDAGLRASCGRT